MKPFTPFLKRPYGVLQKVKLLIFFLQQSMFFSSSFAIDKICYFFQNVSRRCKTFEYISHFPEMLRPLVSDKENCIFVQILEKPLVDEDGAK